MACVHKKYLKWRARLESNQRSSASEADALSTGLRALKSVEFITYYQIKSILNFSFASPATYREPAMQTASFLEDVEIA